MRNRSEYVRVLLLSIGGALLTLLPYLLSSRLVNPEGIFSGFLLNPIDGFSYLAKMRQGYGGAWLFTLPYSSDSGEGAILFTYYVFLGHLMRWTGLPALSIYHGARVIGALIMNLAGYAFLRQLIEDRRMRWVAFTLFLIGSGFGWIGLLFGFLPTDLWVPESIPFLSAYTNPHFPLAIALFLLILVLVLAKNLGAVTRFVLAVLLSAILGMILPFGVVVLGVILLGWSMLESWLTFKKTRAVTFKAPSWGVGLGLGVGGVGWLVYDWFLTLNHPILVEWNAQNITPSPALLDYVFGFGGVLILALLALFRREIYNAPKWRFIATWVLLQSLLLYAPFGLQRRLSLGLYVALISLATVGLGEIVKQPHLRIASIVLVLLSIPSNLVVVGSGLAGVMSMDPVVVLSKDEHAAYTWLAENADPQDLVLAGYQSGNRIPAFAELRVLYGHPFETPHAEEQKKLIKELFQDQRSYSEIATDLQSLRIRYVLYGPEERELGEARWLSDLSAVADLGDFVIYEMYLQ